MPRSVRAAVRSLAVSSLAVGNHTISAIYVGSGNYSASDASLGLTVNPNSSTESPALINTSTSLAIANNPSVFGQNIGLNVTVTPASGGTPTGTVYLYADGALLQTASLNSSGNASFTVASLTAGTHDLTAVFGGNSSDNSSAGDTTQVIGQGNTATSLSTSTTSSYVGQTVTLSANVTATGLAAGTPTGTVTFLAGTIPLGTANLDGSGDASLAVNYLEIGDNSITAVYSGDPNFNSGISTAVSVAVSAYDTTTTLTSARIPRNIRRR